MKIGDYIRTPLGIAKILQIKPDKKRNTTWLYLDKSLDGCCFLAREQEVIKYSKRIIDLIEIGDIVNDHVVFDIAKVSNRAVYIEDNQNKMAHIPYTNEDIKSVLTKEKYERIKYEVYKNE